MVNEGKLLERYKILKSLRQENPKGDLVLTAVNTLSSQRKIEAFYREYVNYLKKYGHSSDSREYPEMVACRTLDRILAYYSEDVADDWYSALSDLREEIGLEVLTTEGICHNKDE